MQDITTVVWENYLSLLREAIDNLNYEEVETFWQKSLDTGSRGVQVRTLIENNSNLLGLSLLNGDFSLYLPFFGRERDFGTESFTYSDVRLLWHAGNISKFLKKGQYSNAYSYAVFHEQESSFLKIPSITLGTLLKEASVGTYLYFFAKCCLAADETKGERMKTILNLHQRLTGSKKEVIENLMRNIADNHDEDVEAFVRAHLALEL